MIFKHTLCTVDGIGLIGLVREVFRAPFGIPLETDSWKQISAVRNIYVGAYELYVSGVTWQPVVLNIPFKTEKNLMEHESFCLDQCICILQHLHIVVGV